MRTYALTSIALTAVLFGSSYLKTAQDPGSAITKKPYQSNGIEGTIIGTIALKGKAPGPLFIDMSADPVCQAMGELKTEWRVVKAGKIANAFVYIRSGGILDEYSFPQPDSPAVLAHKGCRYEPHALAIRVGQPLTISNSDPTIHNTHPQLKNNAEWNQSQSPNAPAISVTFTHPETFIPFKDNQHPWENAWVGVFSHPFFAVSDERGHYSIQGLPPGLYTLVVWHERFGEKTLELTVSPYETRIADFTLDVADSRIKDR
jgi:hypothetical protein